MTPNNRTEPGVCPECNGEGRWYDASHGSSRRCLTCNGTGQQPAQPLYDSLGRCINFRDVHPAQPGSGGVRPVRGRISAGCDTYIGESDDLWHSAEAYRRLQSALAAAQQRIAELRERVRWRPMEEAPKDGSHVLLYRPHIRFVGYHSDAGWCINAPGLPLMQPEPTGWMPLPEIGPLPGGDV